jgi:4-hydroxymandelate oxidase
MDIDDLERRAGEVLPEFVYDYYRATAGKPEVLRDQTAAWEAIRHRPRILRNTSAPDTSTIVLGTPIRTPVMVAPMAQQKAATPRAEVDTATAAARSGTVIGVSTHTAVKFEAIQQTGAAWWFQLYVMRDRTLTEALVTRAVAAGARAIILTVDITGLAHPRPGSASSVEPAEWITSPAAARLSNLTPGERERSRGDGGRLARDLGFDAIGWLRERTGLPVVVKGVLRADDAQRAVDAGAAGLVVSTHGGRGLASAVCSAVALGEVAAAVGGAAEVYVDSGIRSGIHVASALALGARAVFVGRPALWGLAVDGAPGVRRVIEGLTTELVQAMNLLGVASTDEFTPDLIAPAHR